MALGFRAMSIIGKWFSKGDLPCLKALKQDPLSRIAHSEAEINLRVWSTCNFTTTDTDLFLTCLQCEKRHGIVCYFLPSFQHIVGSRMIEALWKIGASLPST